MGADETSDLRVDSWSENHNETLGVLEVCAIVKTINGYPVCDVFIDVPADAACDEIEAAILKAAAGHLTISQPCHNI
jgi:hypothetical protein